MIVLTNADDCEPGRHRDAADEHRGRGRREGGGPAAGHAAWDPSWSRFAGLYRGRGGDSQVVELNQRLVIITPNGANLDNPVQLEPIGNGQFRYVAPGGGGPVGEVVRFVEESGRVVADDYRRQLRGARAAAA